MLKTAQLRADQLIGNHSVLKTLKPADYIDANVGLPTINDILAELEKPGRDPRGEFQTATFADGIEDISDLKPGMVLEGVVSNVAAFGAFVDIGVHQDGLVHVSALADRYIADPRDIVKTGDVVKVKVIDVDIARKRIALSMRLNDDAQPASRQHERPRRQNGKTQNVSATDNAMAAAFARLKQQ